MMLRDEDTGTDGFRLILEEIAVFMTYEALCDLPTETAGIETPMEIWLPMFCFARLSLIAV